MMRLYVKLSDGSYELVKEREYSSCVDSIAFALPRIKENIEYSEYLVVVITNKSVISRFIFSAVQDLTFRLSVLTIRNILSGHPTFDINGEEVPNSLINVVPNTVVMIDNTFIQDIESI